jgi:large subunit ribosomal protein L20
MVRVKKGVSAKKAHKNLLRYTKGYKWRRKNTFRAAREATLHAWTNAFRGRKEKKREYRGQWQMQINAACRLNGTIYSKFIFGLKKHKIELDRKVLAELAINHPETFKKILEKAMN